MSGLLEVRVLHAADAKRAEAGGADRLELVGRLDFGGLSPEPRLLAEVRRATTLPIRVLLRLRDGFGTDGGELSRLQGLAADYRSHGADGLVLGFLNELTEIDLPVMTALLGDGDLSWTFHRAVDSCMSTDRAWRELARLPGLDQVHTAGSARGVAEGLEDLIERARTNDFARSVIMAGGDLQPDQVPWLVNAGVRAFHLDSGARPGGSWKAYVDADLLRTWRTLIDSAVQRSER